MTITDWIQKTWKKVWWDEILGIILAITIIAMIIAVARKGQTLDNVLLAGLIAVTTWYAYATIKIARATKQQASASVKMAEEMREQRIITSRPLIIQKAVYEKDIWEGSTENDFSHFEISNVGNTPAIEVKSLLMDNEGNQYAGIQQTYLRKDDAPIKLSLSWPWSPKKLEESKAYYLVSEYQSIFSYEQQKSTWYQTRLPFETTEGSQEGKKYVFHLGKLEFKEVSEKERIDAFRSRSKPK